VHHLRGSFLPSILRLSYFSPLIALFLIPSAWSLSRPMSFPLKLLAALALFSSFPHRPCTSHTQWCTRQSFCCCFHSCEEKRGGTRPEPMLRAPAHSTVPSTSYHHDRRKGTETVNPKGAHSECTQPDTIW
jgi:hypothetical protein